MVEALPRSLPAAVVMIDLDHFKPINDRAGHAAGDAMLKAVAAAIVSRVRATDLVVRLGGDEFALLLERCPHDTALRIAENVRQAVAAIELNWEGQALRVGASLGVASLGAETLSADDWLAAADAACYAARPEGRGAVRAAAPGAARGQLRRERAPASATASAVMLTMRRTVEAGLRMCAGAFAPSRMGPTVTPCRR